VGRYGKHLTGSDVQTDGESLESMEFDSETRELLGLDDIEEILGQIDEAANVDVEEIEEMEQEADAVSSGTENIRSADEVIEEMDDDLEAPAEPEPEPE
jgi:YbbR domain-containing protein